jgi:hypothetical protein
MPVPQHVVLLYENVLPLINIPKLRNIPKLLENEESEREMEECRVEYVKGIGKQ